MAPLLTIQPLPLPPLALRDFDGVIITSRNGARRLIALSSERRLPVYAVGAATGELLRQAGFETVRAAEGDLASLRQLLRRELPPGGGHLLHLCGRHRAGDPAAGLTGLGYSVTPLEAYDSQLVESLPPTVRTSIAKSQLDGVLLFSPRTAKSLTLAMEKSELSSQCRKMVAFCLSDKVAQVVRLLPWRQVIVARAPEQDSLLAAVARFAAQQAKPD